MEHQLLSLTDVCSQHKIRIKSDRELTSESECERFSRKAFLRRALAKAFQRSLRAVE